MSGWGRKPPVRFPGFLQDDAESIERRRWYAEMERPIFDNIQRRDELYRIAKGDLVAPPQPLNPDLQSYRKRVNIVESDVQQLRYLFPLVAESEEASVAVVCFPGVGDSLTMFGALSGKLAEAVNYALDEGAAASAAKKDRVPGWWMNRKPTALKPSDHANVFSVCLPGRMHRANDPHIKSWKKLLFEIRDELFVKKLFRTKATVTDQNSSCRYEKIIFVGHCLGGLIAFELCRLLSFQQCEISQLIVIDTKSPLRQSNENREKMFPAVKERTAMEVMYGLEDESEVAITYHLANDKVIINWLIDVEGIPSKWLERKDILRKSFGVLRYEFFMLENYFVQEPYLPNQDIRANTIKDGAIADKIDKEEIDNLLDMPPSLYKISVPIVSLHTEHDKIISLADIEAWKLSSSIHHAFVQIPGIGHYCLHHEGVIRTVVEFVIRVVRGDVDSDDEAAAESGNTGSDEEADLGDTEVDDSEIAEDTEES